MLIMMIDDDFSIHLMTFLVAKFVPHWYLFSQKGLSNVEHYI